MTQIRLAEAADAPQLQAIYAPIVRDTFISFEQQPPDADEIARRLAKTLHTHPWLVFDEDGELLGYAYAGPHRSREAYQWSVDVSVYVKASARRRGIAAQLYTRLFDLLRLQHFTNAYAGIALPNDASVRLHERMGMRPIGVYRNVGFKQGQWRDVGWWHLALGDYPPDPAPPRLLATCLREVRERLNQPVQPPDLTL